MLHTFVVQRTKWFADSLSCSHCSKEKFVFSTHKNLVTWSLPFLTIALAAGRKAKSDPKLGAEEEMCFAINKGISLKSFALAEQQNSEISHISHCHDGHFLSRDLRRKRFSDQTKCRAEGGQNVQIARINRL